jgi:hypothetical protein
MGMMSPLFHMFRLHKTSKQLAAKLEGTDVISRNAEFDRMRKLRREEGAEEQLHAATEQRTFTTPTRAAANISHKTRAVRSSGHTEFTSMEEQDRKSDDLLEEELRMLHGDSTEDEHPSAGLGETTPEIESNARRYAQAYQI